MALITFFLNLTFYSTLTVKVMDTNIAWKIDHSAKCRSGIENKMTHIFHSSDAILLAIA